MWEELKDFLFVLAFMWGEIRGIYFFVCSWFMWDEIRGIFCLFLLLCGMESGIFFLGFMWDGIRGFFLFLFVCGTKL